MATSYTVREAGPDRQYSTLHIFSDCQSALKAAHNSDLKDSSTVASILQDVSNLHSRDINVKGSWVCGHADLEPNEIADSLAKAAAAQASIERTFSSLTLSTAKSVVKAFIKDKWQKNWNNRHTDLYHRLQTCTTKTYKSFGNRFGEVKRNRLRLGHSRLKSNLKKIKLTDCDTCNCGLAAETLEHIFYDCQIQYAERENFLADIERIYAHHDIAPPNRTINLDLVLGLNDHLPASTRTDIDVAVHKFLSSYNFKL
jgi:hypothetical protein